MSVCGEEVHISEEAWSLITADTLISNHPPTPLYIDVPLDITSSSRLCLFAAPAGMEDTCENHDTIQSPVQDRKSFKVPQTFLFVLMSLVFWGVCRQAYLINHLCHQMSVSSLLVFELSFLGHSWSFESFWFFLSFDFSLSCLFKPV